jgi:hypothetical protein
MYTLSKLFSAVSYSSRNKYLANNDKIYWTVVQETQAELALTEEKVRASIRDRSTSTKNKVVPFRKFVGQNIKPNKKDYSLGFIFPRKSCQSTKRNQSHL